MIFTIGHSNHKIEYFISLLQKYNIDTLIDIRSHPYSRHAPQFNRKNLSISIKNAGIKYIFLGHQLGGRPENIGFYDSKGRLIYERLSHSPLFLEGIAIIEKGLREGDKIALMCSEEDPGICHRRLLVGRFLEKKNIEVSHIRGNGNLELVNEKITKSPHQLSLF